MNKPVFALLLCLPVLAALPQELIGTRFLSLSVFALGALVGSLLYSWQRTAVLSAVAVAVAVPAALVNDTFPPAVDGMRLLSTLPILVFAVTNAAVRTAREQRLRDVLAVSRVAQSTILRPVPPQLNGVPLAACYRSAAAESRVGGDLYDVLACAGRIRIVVGDVRGKGLGSVQVAARTVAAFREAAQDEARSLPEVVQAVQRSVSRELAAEDFVTAAFAEFDPVTGVLWLANCGHPSPLVLGATGQITELSAAVPSPPLGLAADPGVEVRRLAPQDRVLLFSDGLIEARDGHGDFFPLGQHLSVLAAPDLSDGVDALMSRFDAFTRSPADDLVVLAFAVPATAGQLHRGCGGDESRSARLSLGD